MSYSTTMTEQPPPVLGDSGSPFPTASSSAASASAATAQEDSKEEQVEQEEPQVATPSLAHLQVEVDRWMQLLDPALTTEYHRALEVIPDIVRKETRVQDFLRRCQSDPQAAATRLAAYWKTRKQVFGERWLLPMTQSGSGALTAADIAILRSGFCKVVQSATLGTITINDFSLLPQGSTQMQTRIAFYLVTILGQEEFLTSLFVVRSGSSRPVMTTSKEMIDIKACSPSQIKNIFVARAFEEGREHLLDYLGYQQQRMTQVNYQQAPRAYIASNSLAGTLQALQAQGFDQSCLPRELGGHVDQSTFDNWVRMRLSLEDILGAAPILRQRGAVAATTALAVAATVDASALTRKVKRGREYPTLTRGANETAAAFQKRKNACYVRRNYHRQKLEIMAVQGEAAKCRETNAALRQEHVRLEQLLQQAQAVVKEYLETATIMVATAATLTTHANKEGEQQAPPLLSNEESTRDAAKLRGDDDDSDSDSISFASILVDAKDSDIDLVPLDDLD